MQGNGRILSRAGAAHVADAVVADQDGCAQTPADLARRPRLSLEVALCLWLLRLVLVLGIVLEGTREGEQRFVPASKPRLVGCGGIARYSLAFYEVSTDRLASQFAPDVREVLEQLCVRQAAIDVDAQAGGLEGGSPGAESVRDGAGRVFTVPAVEGEGQCAVIGMRHPAHVGQQLVGGWAPVPQLDRE